MNKLSSSHSPLVRRLLVGLLLLVACCGALQAQVAIPGTRVQYTFPSKWRFLSTQKIDQNTTLYHYYYTSKIVVSKGDTALPYLRIRVRKNYTGTIYDYVYDTDEIHSEGVDIPEDYSWTIPGYFAPGGEADAAIARSLSVRITYDVYAYNVFDNNKEERVRENCVAVNKLPAITIGEEKTELQRGQSTTITLTVKPTYIYVLYDDELNNPTLTIE